MPAESARRLNIGSSGRYVLSTSEMAKRVSLSCYLTAACAQVEHHARVAVAGAGGIELDEAAGAFATGAANRRHKDQAAWWWRGLEKSADALRLGREEPLAGCGKTTLP